MKLFIWEGAWTLADYYSWQAIAHARTKKRRPSTSSADDLYDEHLETLRREAEEDG